MTEIEILKNIAENLSQRESSAALNNYEVLGNNIKYLNDSFVKGISILSDLQNSIESAFGNDELVTNDFEDVNKTLFYFRQIIPRIILNDISIIE